MSILYKAVSMLNGWKTVVMFLIAQIPFIVDNPLLLDAINKVIANVEDVQAWVSLIVQLLLAIGVIDIIRKNVTQGVARAGASVEK